MKSLCGGIIALTLLTLADARAWPDCQPADDATLCRVAGATLSDNPSLQAMHDEAAGSARERTNRQARRRGEAVAALTAIAAPTWRDLFYAGYVIAYGDTPDERLSAHAIAIRALSLAPDEPDARFLVAMTFDGLARDYADRQVYGLQKFYKLAPDSGRVEYGCLPHVITTIPESVAGAFYRQSHGLKPCAPGQGPP